MGKIGDFGMPLFAHRCWEGGVLHPIVFAMYIGIVPPEKAQIKAPEKAPEAPPAKAQTKAPEKAPTPEASKKKTKNIPLHF